MTRFSLAVLATAFAASALASALPGGYQENNGYPKSTGYPKNHGYPENHPHHYDNAKHCNKWKPCGYGEKCVDQPHDHCHDKWWCPQICVPESPKYQPQPQKQPQPDKCKSDSDCHYGEKCQKDNEGCKVCTKPKYPVSQPQPSKDQCSKDQDCSYGQKCMKDDLKGCKVCKATPTPKDQCSKDTDCSYGQTCQTKADGCKVCKATPPAKDQCSKDTDCAYGQQCLKDELKGCKRCQMTPVPTPTPESDSCTQDSDCQYGAVCKFNATCPAYPKRGLGNECEGVCEMPPPGPAPCSADADCPGPGDTCQIPDTCLRAKRLESNECQGQCVPPPKPCSADSECNADAGQTCQCPAIIDLSSGGRKRGNPECSQKYCAVPPRVIEEQV